MRSKFSVGSFILGIVVNSIIISVLAAIAGALCFTPLLPLGVLLAFVAVMWFFATIKTCIKGLISYVVITDEGMKGRSGFKRFDLTYDQIDRIELPTDNLMCIYCNNRKKTVYKIGNIKNLAELRSEYARITNIHIELYSEKISK